MLTHRIHHLAADHNGPTIFLLHWLGGSARTWTEVGDGLAARGLSAIAIDLPGFGDAANVTGYSVSEMAEAVTATIAALRATHPDAPWLLAGHSMGGKVAAVIARAAAEGAPHLSGLLGLILVSPSPPGPEPMPDSKRAHLLKTLGQSTGDPSEDRKLAADFVDDNTGKPPLDAAIRDRAIADILRMSRAAFTAWLHSGSREDHAAAVGILPLPALLVAGTEDAALGPAAQREHTLPHLADAELVALRNTSHLAPLKRAPELIELIAAFTQRLGLALASDRTTELSSAFAALVEGPRTASQTRAVLQARLQPDDASSFPPAISLALMPALRALVETIIPGAPFDLTARLNRTLATGTGDGWRFATLPADAAAWRTGLASLDAAAWREYGLSFIALPPSQRRALVEHAQQGKLGKGLLGALHLSDAAGLFDAEQMQQWSEDVRALLARLYVADPRTMQRIGFTGFADGASTNGNHAGFTHIQLGDNAEDNAALAAQEPA
jgi:pimeloyl-ACP methyl ester carboxylesterase